MQLNSCDNRGEIDTVFDKTPTERLNAKQKEINNALEASEFGWKAVYFTDTTQLGGFTHLFKFKSGEVEMASDFDDDTAIHKSQYSIDLGSTVSLVFTTKNKIHLLSDSNNAPTSDLKGRGYKGDFQFLYYGQEKDQLIFRANRSLMEVRFIKAKAEDWTNLSKNRIMIANIRGDYKPLFRSLETYDGAKLNIYNFNYSSNARFAKASSVDPESKLSYNIGIGFTPTGITIQPPLKIGNQKLTEFTYDPITSNFNAVGTNGLTASIKYSNKPLTLTNDYKNLLLGQPRTTFAYFDNDVISEANTNSSLFYSELDKVNSVLPNGLFVVRVVLNFNILTADNKLTNSIQYLFSNNSTLHHFVSTTEDATNKTIILTHQSWTAGVPLYLQTALGNFDSFFRDPKGIYVRKEDYKIKYTNNVYTFSAGSNPFRMTTWQL